MVSRTELRSLPNAHPIKRQLAAASRLPALRRPALFGPPMTSPAGPQGSSCRQRWTRGNSPPDFAPRGHTAWHSPPLGVSHPIWLRLLPGTRRSEEPSPEVLLEPAWAYRRRPSAVRKGVGRGILVRPWEPGETFPKRRVSRKRRAGRIGWSARMPGMPMPTRSSSKKSAVSWSSICDDASEIAISSKIACKSAYSQFTAPERPSIRLDGFGPGCSRSCATRRSIY